jgi:adenylate cyclase class IV
MVDRTRAHLDEVAGLGTFVELEARRLMAAFGIQEDQLVSRAHTDLLQASGIRQAR